VKQSSLSAQVPSPQLQLPQSISQFWQLSPEAQVASPQPGGAPPAPPLPVTFVPEPAEAADSPESVHEKGAATAAQAMTTAKNALLPSMETSAPVRHGTRSRAAAALIYA
jgi:hypothetical protein